MSLLDELQEEAARRNPLAKKRAQIKALRDKAQSIFKDQFLVEGMNKEKIAFQKGRIEAFEECLQILRDDNDRQSKRNKDGDE